MNDYSVTRVEILILGPVPTEGSLPQMLATSEPDLSSEQWIHLWKTLTEIQQSSKSSTIDLDAMIKPKD